MSYAGKIKIDTNEFPIASTLYGTCSSLASAVEKAVVLANFDELVEGVSVAVKFVYSNTAQNPTLNVNGTGARRIYKYGTIPPGVTAVDSWNTNSIVSFVYDGTSWMMTDVNPDYNMVVSNIITEAMLRAYPVGSIYMSMNSTNPAALFGGTWEQLRDRFLVGAGNLYEAGATGGTNTVTLNTNQIPAHTHGSKTLTGGIGIRNMESNSTIVDWGSGIVSYSKGGTGRDSVEVGRSSTSSSSKATQITVTATHTHDSVGGGQGHENRPPYLAVYVWKRTA